MADACVLLIVSYNVNCKILLTLILCYSIAVKMDKKPVRVKQELCDNEGEEVEIMTGRDFGAEEATTTAAVGVKREGEGMIKSERRNFMNSVMAKSLSRMRMKRLTKETATKDDRARERKSTRVTR